MKKFLKSVWFPAVAIVFMTILAQAIPTAALQEPAKPHAAPTATTTPAPKIEEKPLAVAEVRRDKVRILQLEEENLQLKKQALVNKLLETEEWKELDAPHKKVQAKLQAELVAVLKAGGVKEEDFPLYEYDKETMTLKKKVVAPAGGKQ